MNHYNFFLESFTFTGFIVPIAFCLMVRSQFYNGALILIKFIFESIFSVFIGLSLLVFFYEQIHLIMNESVLMLYYIAFYEMTHKPYILEFYIVDIFSLFLSPVHLSTSFFYIFASQLRLQIYFFVYAK